jgi:hypothetical protein
MNQAPHTTYDALWRRFEREVDLYKSYLDLALKASLFAFGITGAMASYVLKNESPSILVWSLLLPIILNAGFFLLFKGSVKASTQMIRDHHATCESLGTVRAFDMRPLPNLCRILSFMYLLVSLGLSVALLLSSMSPSEALQRTRETAVLEPGLGGARR